MRRSETVRLQPNGQPVDSGGVVLYTKSPRPRSEAVCIHGSQKPLLEQPADAYAVSTNSSSDAGYLLEQRGAHLAQTAAACARACCAAQRRGPQAASAPQRRQRQRPQRRYRCWNEPAHCWTWRQARRMPAARYCNLWFNIKDSTVRGVRRLVSSNVSWLNV